MSSLYKMPTSTSKIPLPKSSISSPHTVKTECQDLSAGTSPQSRIPIMKGVRSPVHDNSFTSPISGLNKENISVDHSQNSRKSRIPDIRSKRSPTKEVQQDADGGYRSDHSTKSVGSGSKIPGTKTPTSPSKIPTSIRTPHMTASPSRIPLRSSVESLSAEELDLDNREYNLVRRYLMIM